MDVRDVQPVKALLSVNEALPLLSEACDASQHLLTICAWFRRQEYKATIKVRVPATSSPGGHDDGMEVSR